MRKMRRSLLMMLWSFLPLVSAVSQTILTNFPLTYPNAIASNPVTNRIYVASGNNSTVTVINGVDDSLVTVPAGFNPTAVAVNTVTNKIYVTDYSDYVITIIDGATNLTSTVPVSGHPQAVAVNSVTNQIYVLASGQNDSGILNVIDGTTLATTAVATGNSPVGVVVDPVTNFIYVLNANFGPGSVSCIDGRTLSVRTVQVSTQPSDIAVNVKTNKIYVASSTDNDVIVIDGATLTTTVVPADNYPARIALNPATNKIYLANSGGQSVTVLDGLTLSMTDVPIGGNAQYIALDPVTNKIYVTVWNFSTGDLLVMVDGLTNATSSASLYRPTVLGTNPATNRVYVSASVVTNGPVEMVVAAAPDPVGMQFVPVAPCRVVDTRNPNGPFGGPAISGGTSRSFALPSGPCSSIPSTAVAYSLNVTAIPTHTLSYLTIWPTGGSRPQVSTLNSFDGRTKANAAIVPAGTGKAVSVYVSDTSNVVLDIDGYFVPAPDNTALEFYKLTPCRVADTRNPDGPLGGPYLQAEQAREFPVLEAQACGIPGTAQAYSMNFTVIPKNSQPLSYLTIWPSGLSRPVVSTLNDPTGTIVANAGIVPAGTGGDISAYATADTDLVIDINGYFAPAATNGLSLFSMWPCRSLDTRGGSGVFSGTLPVDIVDSLCGVGYGSLAYVFNATVLPSGPLGYLTLWPNGAQQPLVSTLNAPDGATTSNMAVVPTNNGVINAFATSPTQLLLDVSGYFAVLPRLRVLTPSLPVATTGTPYGAMFNAAGGAPPYSWSIGSGLLPDGLSLNANTGAITGTPTGCGVSEFTSKVTDSNSLVATANLSIGVQSSALTITTAFLPPATVGVPYSAQLQATGGIPPYNWQLSWGRLPSGLSLDANTGIISGTPTVYDSESFDVLVGDSNPTQNTDFVTLGIGSTAVREVASTGKDGVAEALAAYAEELQDLDSVSMMIEKYAGVVAATCQQSVMQDYKFVDFDLVIVDLKPAASGQAQWIFWIPMSHGKKIVLVGDHKQLPHMLEPEVKDSFIKSGRGNKQFVEESLFQRLFEKFTAVHKAGGPKRVVTLLDDYRMHPVIGKFVRKTTSTPDVNLVPAQVASRASASTCPIWKLTRRMDRCTKSERHGVGTSCIQQIKNSGNHNRYGRSIENPAS